MEEKRQKKQNQFLNGKKKIFPQFFLFTFYD